MQPQFKKTVQIILYALSLGIFTVTSCTNCSVNHSMNYSANRNEGTKLWYETPANPQVPDSENAWKDDKEWLSALPLGNGSLGAMIFGGVYTERIQLNEESMWSGSVQDGDNPEAAQNLGSIRKLLFEGKYKEAEDLTRKTQICKGRGSGFGNGTYDKYGSFQTLGELRFDFANKEKYTDYYRELDLEQAVARVQYTQGNVIYQRESFISAPDQVLVTHLSANKKGQIAFSCSLDRLENYKVEIIDDELVMSGILPDGESKEVSNGLKYMARLKVIPEGRNAKVEYDNGVVSVKDADEAMVFLTASTDYKMEYPECKGRDYKRITKDNLEKAIKKSYKSLLKRHVAEYSKYFSRVSLKIDAIEEFENRSESKSENKSESKSENKTYEKLFQFGRYLLISSSRPGTLPANLQGLWASKIQSPWNGDYHTNINVQMNYWPSEVTNLPETTEPYLHLIEFISKPGAHTAKIQYGLDGWVVHPITNIWGFTSPGESSSWGLHTAAAAWVCRKIMDNYRFTHNTAMLKKMYPVLKGACEFYMGWLVEEPKTGELVSGPAGSPENTFYAPDGYRCQISMGPTHDQQAINQLFLDFIEASAELEIENEFISKVVEAEKRLKKTKIGSDGRIMEWAEEFKEPEPGNRHMSHLYALYPGTEISMFNTPELAEAAMKSMDYRLAHGGGHTGWSSAWLISLNARLHRGDKALENLNTVISKNLYTNMFSSHPPYQIDANFGATAGIAEMLLQSYSKTKDGKYRIELLPALPKSWKNGSFKGLRARGGYVVDAKWENGKVVDYNVKPVVKNPSDYVLILPEN